MQEVTINQENPVIGNVLVAARKNAVLCAERMPTKSGYYRTNIGVCYLEHVPSGLGLKAGLRWQFGATPQSWEE